MGLSEIRKIISLIIQNSPQSLNAIVEEFSSLLLFFMVFQETGNGEQGTGNRGQGTGDGKRKTGSWELGTGNRKLGTGNREEGTGNGKQGTGNGEMGNRKQETGNREREMGNRKRGTDGMVAQKQGDFATRTEQKTISQFHDFTKQQNHKTTKTIIWQQIMCYGVS